MNFINKSKGYTLIEIVVVISIMAVMTTIIYSSFDASRAKSRDQKRVSDVSTIQIALEQYFQKNGLYPTRLSDLTPTFISSIPTDPTNNYNNNYFPITKTLVPPLNINCVSYQLWTKFESTNPYLDSRKGFNSTALPANMLECKKDVLDIHGTVNASADPLVYDVMP